MTISDYTNSGTPQLYMRTDKGFECVNVAENKEQTSIENNCCKLQKTSVLYKFCVNKLQVKYYFEYVTGVLCSFSSMNTI